MRKLILGALLLLSTISFYSCENENKLNKVEGRHGEIYYEINFTAYSDGLKHNVFVDKEVVEKLKVSEKVLVKLSHDIVDYESFYAQDISITYNPKNRSDFPLEVWSSEDGFGVFASKSGLIFNEDKYLELFDLYQEIKRCKKYESCTNIQLNKKISNYNKKIKEHVEFTKCILPSPYSFKYGKDRDPITGHYAIPSKIKL